MAKSQGPKRVGTWNLEGRWSRGHEVRLNDADCDVWLLTEVHPRSKLPGYRMHRSKELMADRRHWAALAVRDGLPMRAWVEDPHPASVAADVDGLTFCASVLPWRACGSGHPWRGRTVAARTEATTSALTQALPPGETIWGGDWNHALRGREYAGSLAGRQRIIEAAAALELTVVTADLPHQRDGLYTIDHIAVPSLATVGQAARLPTSAEGRSLSDHDAYVVEFALPHRWSVYVIEVLGLGPNHVCVGQSWYPPEERLRQHAAGVRAARVFKRDGVTAGRMRPDLLPSLPALTTEETALEAERAVAEQLRARGYTVHGGH